MYAIPSIEVEGVSVVTNTAPLDDGSRRRKAGGVAGDRAHGGSLRGRDRHGSGRGPAQELHPEGRLSLQDRFRGDVRLGRLRGRARARAARRRLRRAAGRAAAPPRRRLGRELGIGISSYTEITNPLGEEEYGEVEITADGGAIVHTGSFSHGQGHETTFAMIAAERLGLPIERITVVKGDTDDVPRGTGTFGSKSTQIGGMAARGAADEVVERAKALVGDYLEASAADVVLDTDCGRFHVAGAPQPALSWAELAERAAERRPARRAEGRSTTSRRLRRSRSAFTSPSSRSMSRPGRSSSSASSRWTTRAR